MAKKDKALVHAAQLYEKRKKKNEAEGKSGGKATVPEEGKAQLEILDCLLGKDNWENKAYNFELKVVGGINEGRKFKKSLALEAKEPPAGFSEDQIIEWTFDALEKLGVENPMDRDEVEGLTGAIVNATFAKSKKHKSDPLKWPVIYFNSMEVPPQDEDEGEEEDASVEEDDLDYLNVE